MPKDNLNPAILTPDRAGSRHKRRRSQPAREATESATTARIIDAVEDQTGERHIRYGTLQKSVWISVQELCLSEREVFARLAKAGFTCLTAKARNDFKSLVQDYSAYRPGIVASRPGWIQGCYIYGDGTVEAPRQRPTDNIIVTFESDPKSKPSGSLKEWKEAVGPIVARQPTLMFALGYAFVGPLLALVSRHYLNPQLEIVGKGETGKSTAGLLAASVWAGNPGSETGGAESWDLTLNAIDGQKMRHADNLLVLDELNLAGADERQQSQMLQKAVFKLAGSGQKRRHGDTGALEQTALAIMSTTNESLLRLVGTHGRIGGAIESRLISIRIPEEAPFGVLASVPNGVTSSRDAVEALRKAIDRYYGAAGRRFIRMLVRAAADREDSLRAEIEQKLEAFDKFVKKSGIRNHARIEKAFALAYAAASLAKKWKILPDAWHPLTAVRDTYLSVSGQAASATSVQPADPLWRIRDYYERNKGGFIDISKLSRPLDEAAFQRAAGFVRGQEDGRKVLLIPSGRFKAEFSDHVSLMNHLRELGVAQTEGGRQPKLTIKAPRSVCRTGRVYCITMDTA
jgi:hypothetical protein